MHSKGDVDSTTEENKQLLGLQDGTATSRIDKETFSRDFQEINEILRELNQEVRRL